MAPSRDAHGEEEAPFHEGDSFGPYRLLCPLGRGGFAPVYLAEEIHDGKKLREVALKLFFLPKGIDPASPEASAWREGVLSEARALCRVQHPSVVRFYSVHRDKRGDALGLAMEYVGGESLEGRMLRRGNLDDQEVLDAATQVAWALSAVHAAGLVHRDVKPANIVCGPFGYKLIDFGVVADLDPSRLEHTEAEARRFIVGTPGYIAPECLYRGAIPSPASDLYALGATIRKLFAGRLPSAESTLADAETMAVLEATIAATIDPTTTEYVAPRSVPAALVVHERADVSALVEQLLAPEPSARPQHADWVARELERMRAVGHEERSVPSMTDVAFARPFRPDPPDAEPGPSLVRSPPLVGRDDALAVIDAALEDMRRARVQVVLVSGPLGVGRTRLLDAAAERAALPKSRVLRAACRPERQSLLRPLVRATEALSAAHPGALSGLREALSAALLHEVLREARAPGSELEVVEAALSQVASDEPLCLVIDDLQWGDAYTLELVRRLCDRAAAEAGARLVLFASLRHEPNPSAPLRALQSHLRARVHPSIRHVSLSPLGAEDALRVAREVAPLSPELEHAAVRGSGNVPFFLVNGIFAWRATGAIVFKKGHYRPVDDDVLSADLPGASELLQARFARSFSPKGEASRLAARALAAVALHGGALEVDVLAEVLGADVRGPLETLVRAGLLSWMGDGPERRMSEVGFPEEMSRQAALNVARARPWFVVVHRSLLDVVAARPSPDAAFLAFGYDKLGETSLARHWFGKAMDEATAAGLFADAAALGDRLAALLSDPRERAAVELRIARALVEGRFVEDARARIARLEEEERSGRVTLDAATSLGRRILRLFVARARRDASVHDDALIREADAHGDPALRGEARLAVAGLERGEGALVIVSEAIAITEGVNRALEFSARVLRAELGHDASPPQLSLAASDLERALQIAHETASVWQEIHIESDLAVLEAELGNVHAAIERLRKLERAAGARGMRGDRVRILQNLAAFLLRGGCERDAAETAAEVSRMALEVGDPVLASNAWSLRADALRRLGELDAALVSIDQAILLQSQRGDRMEALSRLRRAEILDALSRPEEAIEDAIRARDAAESRGEQGLSRIADLWRILHRARHGLATEAEVKSALDAAQAAGNTRGGFSRTIMDRAAAWLSEPRAPRNSS